MVKTWKFCHVGGTLLIKKSIFLAHKLYFIFIPLSMAKNSWSPAEMKMMKGIIQNEAKAKKRLSVDEMQSYFEEKTSQSIAAKHRALASKMFTDGEIKCDVGNLKSASGKLIFLF